MSNATTRLAEVFARDIPLSRAMGVQVLSWQEQQLRLQFPLAPNINHQASMFGGSMYCAAVLAGWGWLHLALREEGIDTTHIVVQSGQINYPRPIEHSISSPCAVPRKPGPGSAFLPPIASTAGTPATGQPCADRKRRGWCGIDGTVCIAQPGKH